MKRILSWVLAVVSLLVIMVNIANSQESKQPITTDLRYTSGNYSILLGIYFTKSEAKKVP